MRKQRGDIDPGLLVIAFLIMLLFTAMIGMIVEDENQNECRQTGIQAGKSATDIQVICKF